MFISMTKGLKTREGAIARGRRIVEGVEGEKIRWTVMANADGTFQPIAFLTEKERWCMAYLANSGIYVVG